MGNTHKKKQSILQLDLSFGKIDLLKKAVFAKHLAMMLKSGLVITDALNIILGSSQGRMKKIMAEVLHSVQSGHSLSESLSLYPKDFEGFFVNVTYAGEKSGNLTQNLENIAKQLEKEKQLISKVKGAMIYPVVILIGTFILGMALTFVVLPKIIPLFEGLKMDLPFTTRMLIKFSHFIESYGWQSFLAIILLVVGVGWLLRQKWFKPISHYVLLKFPIMSSIVINTNLSRFCQTLGMLLKSGLEIDKALEITHSTLSNYYYRHALHSVSERIGKGVKLSSNLEQYKSLFPNMTTKMVKVGEESGRLEETLLYLAEYYENEVDNATKSLSTAIEPLLLIFIGVVVGFLALSIISPIYNITGGAVKK